MSVRVGDHFISSDTYNIHGGGVNIFDCQLNAHLIAEQKHVVYTVDAWHDTEAYYVYV